MKIIRIDRLTPTGGTDSPDIGGAGAALICLEGTKFCPGCNQNLPHDAFHKKGKGLYPYCKPCRKHLGQERYIECKKRVVPLRQPDTEKTCTVCKETKTIDHFPRSYTAADGLTSHCRECDNNNSRRWADNNREYKQACDRTLNAKVKADLFAAYGNACVCCGETLSELLAIDHINGGGQKQRKELNTVSTAFYRWLAKNNYPQDDYRLLCTNCNTSLGFYGYCPHMSPSSFDDLSLLDRQTRSTRKLKLDVINGYGGVCVCCGENHIEMLTIDHILGGGCEERRTVYKTTGNKGFYRFLRDNNYPTDKYRCLCLSCNFALGHFGYCPHTRQREELVS